MVASYGSEDRLSEDVGRLERVLDETGISHDVTIYDGAGHSFMNRADLNPLLALFGSVVMSAGYEEEEAAEDAWDRILEFFGEWV